MRKFLTFVAFFCIGSLFQNLAAQQDAQFTQYMFNKLYFNPAVAGHDRDYIEGNLFHRSQWAGYSGTFDPGNPPATQVLSLSAPIRSLNSGIGLHVVNDRIGPMNSVEVMLSYAYHYQIDDDKRLSFGLRGGIYNQSIDFSLFRFRDENDPLLPFSGRESQIKPDVAAGIYFSTPQYFIGLSANHLAPTEFNYVTEINITSLKTHLYLMGGGFIDVSDDILFSPSALIKTEFNTLSYEATALFTYQEQYFGGVAARASNAFDDLSIILGAFLTESKRLRIAYAMDIVFSGRPVKQPTSHEISLGYSIFAPRAKVKPPMRTPRFRF
ncbi:MAG: type IX secretion system membrane protein PorP/SprF [Bernardetiaceae bacterium]|nr:type IX secretion system membrane protein PorP/SprF [Bernardetiaceae bacterium]